MTQEPLGSVTRSGKTAVAAVEGWFAIAPVPHLLGTRCTACRTYFFPPETVACRNPRCASTELETVPLSTTGTLWSFTNNCYKPPAPYVSPEPFEPYVIAAVELATEKMVVLGQVVRGVAIADLTVGMPMELTIDTLFEDEEHEHLVWKWQPRGAK